jgi:hypothetical protein
MFRGHNQSLVGLVVINAELNKENHDSIHRKCDWEGLKPLDIRTDFQTRKKIKKETMMV